MSRKVIERRLSVGNPNDIEFVELNGGAALNGGAELPHLVFLLPGIRTDGAWAQELRFEAQTWAGRPIICRPVRGNSEYIDRLSSVHLVARIGLAKFRESFASQILHSVEKVDASTISIVAHSMGSALFSEIVEDVSNRLKQKGLSINCVVFLGSVCHRKQSKIIAENCKTFVNDVGRRDVWPYIASIIRPFSYGDVGTRGFLDGYVSLDRFFDHNHGSCTKIAHLKNKVLPVIETEHLIELGEHIGQPVASLCSDNAYVYVRRLLWMVFGAFWIWFLGSWVW